MGALRIFPQRLFVYRVLCCTVAIYHLATEMVNQLSPILFVFGVQGCDALVLIFQIVLDILIFVVHIPSSLLMVSRSWGTYNTDISAK